MLLSKINRTVLSAGTLVVAVVVGMALFAKLERQKTVEPGRLWYIRNNAIRQLIARSSASEYIVIRNQAGLDLLVSGRSTPDAIDQLVLKLGVAKSELVDRQGYTFSDYWSHAMPEGKWQFHFEPGSVLVEDFVDDENRFFVVLVYSPKSADYVITVSNAAKILQRME